MPGEFEYISWLRDQTPRDDRVILGPGDDTAILHPIPSPLLLTTDMLMDGTDFHLSEVGPRKAGRKAMAVNLSDIAAMAGEPIAAVVSVALPRTMPRAAAKELYLGMREAADEFRVPIVGGDTNSWDGLLVISVTILGTASNGKPVRRDGAKEGDWIFVTGELGGSILGEHLNFTPRVHEARQLAEMVELHSMIDISDGLGADLGHIIKESGCGAVLFAEAIPISISAHELSRSSGKTALQHALSDGEDFELVFTVSPEDGERLLREQLNSGAHLTKIGECVREGLWLEEKGERGLMVPKGWVHDLG